MEGEKGEEDKEKKEEKRRENLRKVKGMGAIIIQLHIQSHWKLLFIHIVSKALKCLKLLFLRRESTDIYNPAQSGSSPASSKSNLTLTLQGPA